MIGSMRKLCAWTAAALLFLGLAVATGCRSSAVPAAGESVAECPVCKHEGDLACVCVSVDGETPRCECNGHTYYFCSDECREDFEAHPERYVKR